MSISIGIIGNGFVGQATNLFKCDKINVLIYDIDPLKCVPYDITLKKLNELCKIIFICVPTPMNPDGSCHTGIVETCLDNLKDQNSGNNHHIIIRSTVPPGTCKRLNVHHMPEFLTEKNWNEDFYKTEKWIVGMNTYRSSDDDKSFINDLSQLFLFAHDANCILHNNIEFVNSIESEMIKYTRNAFLAVKISFCNEIYQMCNAINIPYDVIKNNFPDFRITPYHTNVPGHDGKLGYGGTCLPKDTQALAVEMRKYNLEPLLLEASVKRNTQIDRPEQEWNVDKGRAVV